MSPKFKSILNQPGFGPSLHLEGVSLSDLPMKEKVPLGYRTNLDHWQVAHQFAVQNLTLPPSMLVAKVTEYVCYRDLYQDTYYLGGSELIFHDFYL